MRGRQLTAASLLVFAAVISAQPERERYLAPAVTPERVSSYRRVEVCPKEGCKQAFKAVRVAFTLGRHPDLAAAGPQGL
eukprot:749349-Hanusia_phi.AAC.5